MEEHRLPPVDIADGDGHEAQQDGEVHGTDSQVETVSEAGTLVAGDQQVEELKDGGRDTHNDGEGGEDAEEDLTGPDLGAKGRRGVEQEGHAVLDWVIGQVVQEIRVHLGAKTGGAGLCIVAQK